MFKLSLDLLAPKFTLLQEQTEILEIIKSHKFKAKMQYIQWKLFLQSRFKHLKGNNRVLRLQKTSTYKHFVNARDYLKKCEADTNKVITYYNNLLLN